MDSVRLMASSLSCLLIIWLKVFTVVCERMKEFYINLTIDNITDENYKHAKKDFKLKTLSDSHDL